MQVCFHPIEQRVGALAVAASALLPALALLTKQRGRDDVFPLDALGAVGLSAYLIPACLQIGATAGAAGPLPVAAAVEAAEGIAIMVDLFAGLGLGGLEREGSGKQRTAEQPQCQQGGAKPVTAESIH